MQLRIILALAALTQGSKILQLSDQDFEYSAMAQSENKQKTQLAQTEEQSGEQVQLEPTPEELFEPLRVAFNNYLYSQPGYVGGMAMKAAQKQIFAAVATMTKAQVMSLRGPFLQDKQAEIDNLVAQNSYSNDSERAHQKKIQGQAWTKFYKADADIKALIIKLLRKTPEGVAEDAKKAQAEETRKQTPKYKMYQKYLAMQEEQKKRRQ